MAQKQPQSALQRHNYYHKLFVGLIKCYGTFATLTGINQLQIVTFALYGLNRKTQSSSIV